MAQRGAAFGPTHGRRTFLAAVTGTVGFAGVVGLSTPTERIRVLAAASLTAALEDRLGPAFESETGVRVDGAYRGTNAILRLVERGDERPDVVLGADVSLLRDRLVPDRATWDVEFATNDVGVAYELATDLGSRLAAGEPWYEVFAAADDGAIGISDPDQNPLGYRALHLFELAERHHELAGFRDRMASTVGVDGQEGQLLGGVEAGNRACAVVYRNMATDRGLPFLSLPPAYNFADPAHEDTYATATYATADGQTVAGSLVSYDATVPRDAPDPENAEQFVAFLCERPALLEAAGLRTPASFPRPWRDVPEVIES